MAKKTRYPLYDVMGHQDEWDDHTQSIVTGRLIREHGFNFLTLEEAEILRAMCVLVMDDPRNDIIQYVIGHIDQTLSQTIGESERKPNVPEASILIREGLQAIERMVMVKYVQPFIQLEESDQKQILSDLSTAQVKLLADDHAFPQKELFQKIVSLTVEAYCSHPTVWSEIGYGGPAYPRGYVRADRGQLDPWEAKESK